MCFSLHWCGRRDDLPPDRVFLDPHPHIQLRNPFPKQREHLSCFGPCSLAHLRAWAGEQTVIWQRSVCAGDFLTISSHAAALGYGAMQA